MKKEIATHAVDTVIPRPAHSTSSSNRYVDIDIHRAIEVKQLKTEFAKTSASLCLWFIKNETAIREIRTNGLKRSRTSALFNFSNPGSRPKIVANGKPNFVQLDRPTITRKFVRLNSLRFFSTGGTSRLIKDSAKFVNSEYQFARFGV